jgi:hypothetical protein
MAKFNADTVQASINLMAERRLERDLKKISEMIRENRLMATGDTSPDRPRPDLFYKDHKGEYKSLTPYQMFKYKFEGTSPFMTQLFEYWLPLYIIEETNAFFSKVDQLQADVDNLLTIERD